MIGSKKTMRGRLIYAGIDEINAHGVSDFSIRRIAETCHVSCAAPYRHFKNKRDFIAAIIDFVNEQWLERQETVLAQCADDLRTQIVEVSVSYIRFLMERPYFCAILMRKDDIFDSVYHKVRGQVSGRTRQLVADFFAACGWDETVQTRKFLAVRSVILGSVVMFDSGELTYNEQAMENIRYCIDREFDLP